MRINPILCVLAAAIAGLITFGLYSMQNTNATWLITIGGFICMVLPLATTLGIRFEETRTTTNVKVLSGMFFAILLVSHFIFAGFRISSTPAYVVINGIVLLLWLLIAYAIAKAKM